MSTAVEVSLPQQVDTEIAALWTTLYDKMHRLSLFAQSAKSQAGAEFYYRGRQYVTDMTLAQAEEILAADIEACDDDTSDYRQIRKGHHLGSIRRVVEGLAEVRATISEIKAQIAELEERYTGWSRFFLVTSSKGHIHRSMNCSTCRPTTTYGWLPNLSGRTEADCVEEFGPALCSVCYPTAPVEWTLAEITKATAAKVSS